jgi:metal-dependent hydrolase (beta-lactamase superfamily II)
MNDYLREQGNKALGASRDRILDLIFRHEHDRHGGGCCMEERIHAVAFIAHSLGLAADDDDAWNFAREIVKQIYEHGHDLH